jgi:predicted small lipoprotein YifL
MRDAIRRAAMIAFLAVLCGCAASGPLAGAKPDECRPEVDRLQAQLAAEVAERQRITRAAARREETLRKQLEAMKSIERGILEREDRMRTETR